MERPSGAQRQSSFARSFFQSASEHGALYGTASNDGNTNTSDDSPGFPVPRSRPASRASFRRRTGSSMSMSMAIAAAAAYIGDYTDDNSDDGFANSSCYADAHQQGRTDTNLKEILTDDRPEDLTGGFGVDEVLEQYRIMAQHEARLRVQANIGFDIDEYENENKATVPTDKRSMYGGIKKPTVCLPEPKRLPQRLSTQLHPEEPPLLPPRPNTKLVQQKSKRVPELLPGSAVRGGGPQSIPPGEHMVRCLGCRSNLRVNQKATLVSCSDSVCKVISPASSTRR